MSSFLRILRRFNRSSVVQAVAVAAAGSTLLYSNNNFDIRASVTTRIPVPLQDSLLWKQPIPSLSGILPLNSYRVDPVPSSDVNKEASGAVHDGSKPHNYFGRDTIANAAAKVGPAVVNIAVPQGFLGFEARNIGSGTIIDKDGTILTCAHVVVDFQGMRSSSKGKIEVTLQDGRKFEGKVVNADRFSDIAIVKINPDTPLPEAKLGSSSALRPGDWVIALGCPHSLQNTVTAGIVSCIDRKSSDLGFSGMAREYLQTDCAINVGNSGGPLVNIDGEVVGVNVMKMFAADGVSFSVPIDSVSKIIDHFKKSGRVVRPWLGVKMLDLNDMIIAQLKKKDATFPNVSKGILVPVVHWIEALFFVFGDKSVARMLPRLVNDINEVTPGSPGDRAGFRPGDVVIEFDGKPVESLKEVIEIMGDKVGVPIQVMVKRAGDILVILTVIPEESNPQV